MAWTILTFISGDLLTAAKMTSLYNNFGAMANGDSGAPKIQLAAMDTDSVGTAQLVTGNVTLLKMASNSVGNAQMLDNSIGNAEMINTASLTLNSVSIATGQNYGYAALQTKYLYLHPADFNPEWDGNGRNEDPIMFNGSVRILGCEDLSNSSNKWIAKIPVSPGVVIYKVEVDLFISGAGNFNLFFDKIALGGGLTTLLSPVWSSDTSKGVWRNAGTPNETTVEDTTYEIAIECAADYTTMFMCAVKITYKYNKVYTS